MPTVSLGVHELTAMKFIRDFRAEKGFSPSVRDIGRAMGIRSTSQIDFYLAKLERANLIRRDKKVARSIVPIDADQLEREAREQVEEDNRVIGERKG